MGVIYNSFMFAGKSSRDFEVWISGGGTFNAPERDVESITIPGRNGDLHIDNGRFNNIQIVYPAFITKDFHANFEAFKAFMLSQRGYKRLSDTYHPDHYRLASYKSAMAPKMTALNRAGSFDIAFDCDPRRFLVSGEKKKTYTAVGELRNPTLYPSSPLIRAYGNGILTINGTTLTISGISDYIDIDCDLQEAYKGTASLNSKITLDDGNFPRLEPGINEISFTMSEIEITPRWWTV